MTPDFKDPPVRHARAFLVAWITVVSISCGGPNKPSGPILGVTSVTPNTGGTVGGTVVTITGTKFAAGATVSLGGVAATNVSVASANLLTASTGQRAAGVVDVVVTSAGASATLPSAFTYVAPAAVVNTPPTIGAMTARGSRSGEPPQFADGGEEIAVSATVADAETPISQLVYEWTSSPGGTFSGAGTTVTWRAPQPATTPVNVTLTLTVIERYGAFDGSGLPITSENRVSKSTVVSVHDSIAEVGGMARQFLLDFSDSDLRDINVIMRNFTDVCAVEKAAETAEVIHNRQTFRITSSAVGNASVTVSFGGRCPFRFVAADACAQVPVDWVSTILATGGREHAFGTDQVSAVYVAAQQRWGLCGSDFDGRNVPASRTDFIR